jgi:hypothetical protein
MTVRELIELLQKEDASRLVVISDGHGDGNATPASCVSSGAFDKDSPEKGVFGPEKENLWDGYTEEDAVEGVAAVEIS